MQVRFACSRDALAIAEVHMASRQTAYRGIIPDEILDRIELGRREAQWLSNIEAGVTRILVAEEFDAIRGFAAFASTRDPDEDPSKVAEIQAIYVEPEAWRKGIGKSLCKSVFADLRSANFSQVTLWVLRNNERAIGFYESMGFSRDGGTKIEKLGDSLEAVRFRREVPRPGAASEALVS